MGKQRRWYFMVVAIVVALFLLSCNNGVYSSFSYTGTPETSSTNGNGNNGNEETELTEGGLIEIIWPWDKKSSDP